jgi:hypothetical protein
MLPAQQAAATVPPGRLIFPNLPAGLRPEDNEAGARLSLEQLARDVD